MATELNVVSAATDSCLCNFSDCTKDHNSCCFGLSCIQHSTCWWQCLEVPSNFKPGCIQSLNTSGCTNSTDCCNYPAATCSNYNSNGIGHCNLLCHSQSRSSPPSVSPTVPLPPLPPCNETVVIPVGYTTIPTSKYSSCKPLKSVTIPSTVTTIEPSAFAGTSITTISIPSSVTTIGNSTFEGCSNLTHVQLPNNLTSLGQSAFQSCTSLISVNIPDSLTTIQNSTFRKCSSLLNIVIPSSVKYVGNYSFAECTSLATVTFLSNNDQSLQPSIEPSATPSVSTIQSCYSSVNYDISSTVLVNDLPGNVMRNYSSGNVQHEVHDESLC